MNIDISLISIPVGGAVIGYITNWLAIKMLFRPHYEKRILGIKLPFTPGLIPKERERIAKAIGEVVGNHLLTTDVIVNELTSEKMDQSICKYMDDMIFNTGNKINIQKVVNQYLNIDLGDERFRGFFVNKLICALKEPENKAYIIELLVNAVDTTLKKMVVSEQTALIEVLNNVMRSEGTKNALEDELRKVLDGNKGINEIFPKEVLDNIKGSIAYNEPSIKEGIKTILAKEEVRGNISNMIEQVIESKFGMLGAMFADPGGIYETIVEAVDNKLDEVEISGFIIEYFDSILDKKLLELMPEDSVNNIVCTVSESVLSEKNTAIIREKIFNSHKSLYEILNQLTGKSFDNKLKGLIEEKVHEFIESVERDQSLLDGMVAKVTTEILQNDIALTGDQRKSVDKKIKSIYNRLVTENAPELIKNAKIIELVEKQINSFDIDMLEEIILSIAKKELAAITWLGALLGFIMSLIILVVR